MLKNAGAPCGGRREQHAEKKALQIVLAVAVLEGFLGAGVQPILAHFGQSWPAFGQV